MWGGYFLIWIGPRTTIWPKWSCISDIWNFLQKSPYKQVPMSLEFCSSLSWNLHQDDHPFFLKLRNGSFETIKLWLCHFRGFIISLFSHKSSFNKIRALLEKNPMMYQAPQSELISILKMSIKWLRIILQFNSQHF
jgi:hypothetical protein